MISERRNDEPATRTGFEFNTVLAALYGGVMAGFITALVGVALAALI